MLHLCKRPLFGLIIIIIPMVHHSLGEITLTRVLMTSEDDIEYSSGRGCKSNEKILEVPTRNGSFQSVRLRFHDIPEEQAFPLQNAYVELYNSGRQSGQAYALVRYNTICTNAATACPFPPETQFSNTSVLWDVPDTEPAIAYRTPNLKLLVKEAIQSTCWINAKWMELIIAPPHDFVVHAALASRRFIGFGSTSSFPRPTLVLRYADPIDGNWGDWMDAGSCTVTCGSGTQPQTRACDNPAPQNDGIDCPGNSTQNVSCSQSPCPTTVAPTTIAAPFDGNWGDWMDAGSCTVTCGSGTQPQTRVCDNPAPQNGGIDCPGNSTQDVSCSQSPCLTTTPPTTSGAPSPPPPFQFKSCSSNIYLKGYLIVNHISAVETVTSTMECCKKCSEMRDSCKSLSIKKPSSPGQTASFMCQINDITKEESDRTHCFKRDDTFTHYNVFP